MGGTVAALTGPQEGRLGPPSPSLGGDPAGPPALWWDLAGLGGRSINMDHQISMGTHPQPNAHIKLMEIPMKY